MEKIIVGVDGSEGSAHALSWAVAEAAVRGWGVRAIMAWGWVDQRRTLLGETFDPGFSEDAARDTLADYLDSAVGQEAARGIERIVVAELPARALIDASKGAALLVVGARGLGGFGGLLLGSVSQRCLHGAHCPVAVLRSEAQPHIRHERVVVGVDGSPGATAALRWAVDEAAARSAVLETLHAWQPPFMGGYPLTALSDPAVYEQAAGEVLQEALAGVDTSGLARPPQPSLVQGSAAGSLVDSSERADLVVVGAHGRSRLHGTLVGSVSQQVAVHATSAVVVVRPDVD
ncbi:MAG: universal stress protein [Acidimicrobiales bacterium]